MSLCRVRLNVNVLVEGPLSDGKSVVRLTSPAAFGVTRMSSGRTSVADPDLAATWIRWVAAVAVAGTVTSRRTVAADDPVVWTPSTMNPPPKSDAVQSAGTSRSERSTRSEASVLTEISKLTFVPGATATPGYGVDRLTVSAAAAVGTPTRTRKATRPRAAIRRTTRPMLGGTSSKDDVSSGRAESATRGVSIQPSDGEDS